MFEPSPPLPEAVAGVIPGKALDLACGSGRHAIYLAERGWHVIAVDGSQVGVDLMLSAAVARGCRERIEAYVADLESDRAEFVIQPEGFDLIVDINYLHRPLFPSIRAGVKPGGLFVAAIHVRSADSHNPHHFLLEPGELEDMVTGWGWDVVRAREGASSQSEEFHTAEIIAKRPDVIKI